jgi:protein transport protein SEC24
LKQTLSFFPKVYIQIAILYTSISGQRRIRIHNLNLNVSNQYSALYPSCELDTIMNYISKYACQSIMHSTPKSIHENIVQQVASILACYRKNCASSVSKGQFILPETLKLMPLYVNSLLKSIALTGSKNITVDERAYHIFRLMCMDVKSSFAYFYPRLISLVSDLMMKKKLVG